MVIFFVLCNLSYCHFYARALTTMKRNLVNLWKAHNTELNNLQIKIGFHKFNLSKGNNESEYKNKDITG